MSKPVRIREFVAVRVEGLAAAENRSFANTVETLLLAALERAEVPSAREGAGLVLTGRDSGRPQPGSRPASARRPHMKKHRPAVQCPTVELVGGVCPDCGWQE